MITYQGSSILNKDLCNFRKGSPPTIWGWLSAWLYEGKGDFYRNSKKKNIPQGRALWNRDNTTSVIK